MRMNCLKRRNYKGFIFTLDAVFSLIVASAAVSLLLFVHFTNPIAASASSSQEALSVLNNMLSTELASILQSGVALPPLQPYKLPSSSEPFGYAGFLSNGSYITAPTEPISKEALTISFWVKPTAPGRYAAGSGINVPGANNSSVIIFLGNSTSSIVISYNISGGLYINGIDENCITTPAGSVPENTWTNVILRQNSTSEAVFINGKQVGTIGTSYPYHIYGIVFGTSRAGPTAPNNVGFYNFTGYIANVQLYASVLNPSKIYQLYKSAINSVPIGNAGLLGWWPLDENANDYSGSGNDGKPHNVNFVRTDYLPIGQYNASMNESLMQTISELYMSNDSMYAQFLLNDSVLGQPRAGIYINRNYSASESVPYFNVSEGSYDLIYNNSPLYVGRPAMTFAAWIYPEGLGTCGNATAPSCIILNKYGSFKFGIDKFGSVCVLLNGTTPGDEWNCTQEGLIKPRTWAGVEITHNTTQLNVSIDGGLVYNLTEKGEVLLNSGPLIIGASGEPGSISGTFNGSIANVQLYDEALPPDAIVGIGNGGLGGLALPNEKLVGWWPLIGNTEDYSGNGDAGIPYEVSFMQVAYTPPTIVNAYEISKSSVPVLLRQHGKSGMYNISVVIWN